MYSEFHSGFPQQSRANQERRVPPRWHESSPVIEAEGMKGALAEGCNTHSFSIKEERQIFNCAAKGVLQLTGLFALLEALIISQSLMYPDKATADLWSTKLSNLKAFSRSERVPPSLLHPQTDTQSSTNKSDLSPLSCHLSIKPSSSL